MIFVTVGTQLPFPRLIDAMDGARTDLEAWMADAHAAGRSVLPPLSARA